MKLLHNLLKGSTLATALLIFQSCYGIPQGQGNAYYETEVKVLDEGTKAPIVGAKVYIGDIYSKEFSGWTDTDKDGNAVICVNVPADSTALNLRLEAEGYIVKDTVIELPDGDFCVKLQQTH